MYSCVLGFLLGVMSLQWWQSLPSLYWLVPAALVLCGSAYYCCCSAFFPFWLKIALQCGCFAAIGCLYVAIYAQHLLHWHLPAQLEGKTVLITGFISSLPQRQEKLVHLELQLATLDNVAQQGVKIRLTWYDYPLAVKLNVGDSWQMWVRLKNPHGLVNPGGFDFEKWLFSRGIRATGYVVNSAETRLLMVGTFRYPVHRLRQYVQQQLQASLAGQATGGLIIALIMGAQNDISQQQWQVMRATGTNHLMAIAGVHIGFVTGFVYLLVNFIWRRIPRCVLWMPALQAAAVSALLAAFSYSALAGFALPTQRALVMIIVFMLGLWLRRSLRVWNSYAIAIGIILMVDPLATFSVSFWLSFGAVFVILYGISGRLKPQGLWWKYGRVQWVVTIGLLPISFVLFQQASLISFLANLIAVPAVGLFVLPLCLVGALLLFITPVWGGWLLIASAKIIAGIWWLLAELAKIPGAVWQQGMSNGWVLVACVMGVLWMMAPRGLPGRWLGLFGLVPFIYYPSVLPKSGEIWLTLLDVGQGLATVIQTRHHSLIFDTGPPMGEGDDAGQRVILPFLRRAGITHIDKLIVSHGDIDHIGGAASLLKEFPVAQVLTSVPRRFSPMSQTKVDSCKAGQVWQWDGVIFRIIHPPSMEKKSLEELPNAYLGNNGSCVLHVEREGKGLFLLTGDIEKSAENYLLQHMKQQLAAVVLIAPHHGSRTSSTAAFVQAVAAKYVLFPVGYRNRYRLPSQFIVARYRKTQAKLLETAHSGALTVKITAQPFAIQVGEQRREQQKIWY